jgi:hypothetical protein
MVMTGIEPTVAASIGLRRLFEEQELPLPPLTREVERRMSAVEEHIFATRPLTVRPYDLAASVVARMKDPEVGETYALAGMDGHGVNSWAVHYFMVTDGLALFLQLPWGGIYMNAESAKARISAAFGWAKELQEEVAEVVEAGLVPDGFHLAAMVSDIRGSHWAFSASSAEPIAWTPVRKLRTDMAAALGEMKSGKFK